METIQANEFECAVCKGIFIKGLTDAEAEEQFKKEFPRFIREKSDGLVCDDCFRTMGF